MSPQEQQVRDLFREVRRDADKLKKAEDPAKLRKRWSRTQRALVNLHLAESGFAVLQRLLPSVGQCYHTAEGALLFFRHADHNLYDIEEKTFERYLLQLTDSVPGVRREWLPKLQAWVRFEAPEMATHFLAYNDSPELNVIAVNTFDGFMWRRNRGGTWERVPNGTDGVLFWTPPDFLAPWEADLKKGGGGKDLEWLCALAHFAEDGSLSVDDQRSLLYAWLLHLFIPALNPVHPIPLHEGVTGSGKSVLGECIGRWIAGPQFEVMDLPSGDAAKAEESIKLALAKRPLVVIDNVDSLSPWLEDFLCRVATGVRMSRRRLYTNAEEIHFTPRAGLIITSRDPHFRREDVARRLLPLRFQVIPAEERRSETAIRAEVDARRAKVWADVLGALARLQDAWPKVKEALKPSHSLADFSIFGALLAAAYPEDSDPAEWVRLMGRLEAAQRRFSVEEDPLADLIQVALDENSGTLSPQPVRDLFSHLAILARNFRRPWPYRSAESLSKVLHAREKALEQALNIEIIWSDHHASEKRVTITRLSSGGTSHPGDDGDHGEASFPVGDMEAKR